MTSKNLFFKLIREDAKRRLWVFALSVIIFFFTFPVNILLVISRYTRRGMDNFDDVIVGTEYVNKAIVNNFQSWTSSGNGFMVFLICGLAVLCATTGFAYLHSRKKTDFYHCLPVKREKLFAVTFLSGILFTAIPYLLAVIITALIVQVKTGMAFSWGSVFTGYLVHMAFYLLIYATVAAAVILTGNTVVSLLGTIVFFAWGPVSGALIYAYYQEYYRTYYYYNPTLEKYLVNSSPIAYYISAMQKQLADSGGNLKNAAFAFGAAILITLVTVYLYKKRPSEGAGRAMAFKWSQAVIKFLIVVPSALLGSLFMRQMQDSGGWCIFGLLCGLLLSYCVIEIIYNFDFRKLFSHRLQLILCTATSFGILAFFYFDLSGYDSYLPSADKIESAAIVSKTLDGDSADEYWTEPYLVSYDDDFESSEERHYVQWESRGDQTILENMKLTDTEHVLAIAQQGIEVLKEQPEDFFFYYDLRTEDETHYDSVLIKYKFKSGREIYRSYYVNYDQMEDSFSSLYAQKEYKETVYPILKEDISRISGINYQEYKDYRHVNLPDDSMKEKLFTTYKEELSALTTAVRNVESPIAAIQFKTLETQALIDQLKSEGDTREYLSFNDWNYYPIYPSFTKTIALLKECGINAGTFLNVQNVEKIEIIGNRDYYKYDNHTMEAFPEAAAEYDYDDNDRKTLIVKDKKQIEAILEASCSLDLNTGNDLNQTCDSISVIAYVPNNKLNKALENTDMADTPDGYEETYASHEDRGESGSAEYESYSLALDADKVPAFVKEAMPLSFD